MGKNSLGMNQKTLQQLLSNPDHSLNLDELFSSYKTIMPTLDIMSNSTIIQEALKTTNKWGGELSQNLRLISTQAAQVAQVAQATQLFKSYKTIIPTLDIMSNSIKIQEALKITNKWGDELSQNLRLISTQAAQVAQATQLFKSYKTAMPMLDAMPNFTIIQEALRMVQIPSSTFQFLSTIDIEEIQAFIEEREVQEEIQQEITSIQEETSVKKVIDFINDWALKIMNAPTTLKEKAPAIYLISWIVLPFIAVNFLLPFVQDVWKEKVLHVSEFTEEKPKENTKQLKQSLEKDFGMALSAVNQIRVTNRETPVFRSHQRISGTIDNIPSNKPVIIIEKKRNWSFIMYTNTLGEEVNGWVFTGNLAK
ncbi:hypothetical protein ICA_04944 [Bacillus cereus BAG1O-3]|uniref:hypothetical protein n=1 Tax=Bacillus cereus group TaxID=86661 RepID=UPI00035383CF|nr:MULTISPECIES: hypothetical protein [Bacillus cereus group]EPF08843.1 hypothetical protein ICA_04944 [Bacillus cereus BAG1O-3]MDR4414342.1 hypothetical protein [Bacillus thuringiensis]